MNLTIDFETRSKVNLSTHGAYVYAADPSTELLCCSYKFDGGPIQTWRYKEEMPADLARAWNDPNVRMVAHNAEFEATIADRVLGKPIEPDRWIDTAAIARYNNLPGSLSNVSDRLKLSAKKSDGSAMKTMCAPNRKGEFVESAELFEALYTYCEDDVAAEHELLETLPPWPEREREIWAANLRVNQRGIPVDLELCAAAVELLHAAFDNTGERLAELTDGEITAGTQTARILKFVTERGLDVEDVQAATVAWALAIPDLSREVREVLELRQASSSAAVRKYQAVLDRADKDGRLRGQFMYCGASQTGRFSAAGGMQVQNLKRGSLDERTAELLYTRDAAACREEARKNGESLIGLLAKSVRGIILAPPGRVFVRSDLDQIELRLVHWIARDPTFFKDVEDGRDPYVALATELFHKDYDDVTPAERQQAKPVALAGCYGQGAVGLSNYAKNYGIEWSVYEAGEMVEAYRAGRPAIVQLWKKIDKYWRMSHETGKRIKASNGFLFDFKAGSVTLPSGRPLFYPEAKYTEGKFGPEFTYRRASDNMARSWGGKHVENWCQALCRDIFCQGLLNLKATGYETVLHAHDEALVEIDEREAEGASYDIRHALSTGNEWATFPVGADAETMKRYRK